jgi:hypothetical protein
LERIRRETSVTRRIQIEVCYSDVIRSFFLSFFLSFLVFFIISLLRFRNISRILDCVSCEKCRLWGKLQILGIGTAIKILLTKEEDLMIKTYTDVDEELEETRGYSSFTSSRDVSLINRQEIIALINTLNQFSKSVEFAAIASHEKEKEDNTTRETAKKLKAVSEKLKRENNSGKEIVQEAHCSDGSMLRSFLKNVAVPSLMSVRMVIDKDANGLSRLVEIEVSDKREVEKEGSRHLESTTFKRKAKHLPVRPMSNFNIRSNGDQVDDEVLFTWEDSSRVPPSSSSAGSAGRSPSASGSSPFSFISLLFLSAVITVIFPLQFLFLARNYRANSNAHKY